MHVQDSRLPPRVLFGHVLRSVWFVFYEPLIYVIILNIRGSFFKIKMARKLEKQKAIKLRLKGMSYSQIKEKLGIGKGTLSVWLENYPLSPERIRELRDKNPRRIENYRNTVRKKRETILKNAFEKAKKDIGVLNNRELFIAGLFIYWAEGGKTKNRSLSLTNTDPSMLKFFIKWLELMNIPKNKLKVNLHLYSDMNISRQISFWSNELKIPISNFRRPYIKKTKLSDITYRNGFRKGTCSVIYENKPMVDYVLSAISYLSKFYGK